MDKWRVGCLRFDSGSTQSGCGFDDFVSSTKWYPSPHYEDLHLLLFKGPKLPALLTPFECSWSALIFKALDFVSLDSPPFGGQRGVCSQRPAHVTVTAAALRRECLLLRKCKEFYKIVTLTSQSLWTPVPPVLSQEIIFLSDSGHKDNRLAS